MFGSNNWKYGTLRPIVTRVFEIRSTNKCLEEQIEYIKVLFNHQNNYPLWVIDKIINKVKEKPKVTKVDNDKSGDEKHRLVLPNKSDKGPHILKSVEKYVRKLFPKKSTFQTTCTGRKLSSQIDIKDKANFKHRHELMYYVNCLIPTWKDNYISETACHIQERIKSHNGRGHKLHMLKRSIEKHHYHVAQEIFKTIAKNFRNNKWKQKILESLWIKDMYSTLNAQDKSLPLTLLY